MTSPPSHDALESLLFLAEAGAAAPEADLHGLRADEALAAAERLIQAAFLRGERVARLIHGKGEGRLRETLHRWLGSHRLVLGFREATAGGVTHIAIVER